MNETELNVIETPPHDRSAYRPSLTYYHANARGTGSALRFDLRPATADQDGSIFACFASQASVGSFEGGVRIFPRFDWENAITVKLNIDDLAHILEVLRGMTENIADGKGLFHVMGGITTVIRLEHRLEPVSGYAFSVSRKRPDAAAPQYIPFFFRMNEALGFSLVIEQSLGLIAFGVPREPQVSGFAAAAPAAVSETPAEPVELAAASGF